MATGAAAATGLGPPSGAVLPACARARLGVPATTVEDRSRSDATSFPLRSFSGIFRAPLLDVEAISCRLSGGGGQLFKGRPARAASPAPASDLSLAPA